MKIALKKHPAGAIICQVNEGLSDNEQELLVRGIAKFLANGKARIVVEIGAKVPKPALEKIEKALKPQVDLAKKLGGDIRFILPGGETVEAAIEHVTGSVATGGELLKAKAEIERLKEENQRILVQLQELMVKVSEPASDSELRAAVDHYKKLSEQIELKKAEPAAKK